MEDVTIWFDSQEGIFGSGNMEARVLGVGKEGVGPPYLGEHLVRDTQLIFHVLGEGQSRVMPVLAEVKVHREVLQHTIKSASKTSLITNTSDAFRLSPWQCSPKKFNSKSS